MEMAFAAQILPEFRAYGRQSGNYWLINIKMPADCFVPQPVACRIPSSKFVLRLAEPQQVFQVVINGRKAR